MLRPGPLQIYLPRLVQPLPSPWDAEPALAALRQATIATPDSLPATLEYAGALWARLRTRGDMPLALPWGTTALPSVSTSLVVELVFALCRLCAMYATSAAEDLGSDLGAAASAAQKLILAADTVDVLMALYARWFSKQGWPEVLKQTRPADLRLRGTLLFCQAQELLAGTTSDLGVLRAVATRYMEVAHGATGSLKTFAQLSEAWARAQLCGACVGAAAETLAPGTAKRLWLFATREIRGAINLSTAAGRDFTRFLKALDAALVFCVQRYNAVAEEDATIKLLTYEHPDEDGDSAQEETTPYGDVVPLPLQTISPYFIEVPDRSRLVWRLLDVEADRFEERQLRLRTPPLTPAQPPKPAADYSRRGRETLVPEARSVTEEALVLKGVLTERWRWVASTAAHAEQATARAALDEATEICRKLMQ